jgi:hypothetical protein
MLATLCVDLSLTLVALSVSDPASGFCLGTLSVAGPSVIMGPILDIVVIFHDVEGASCEELGWRVKSCLLHLFTAPTRARRFASSIVTPHGYQAGGHPCAQPMSSRMISHHLMASFPMAEKKKR